MRYVIFAAVAAQAALAAQTQAAVARATPEMASQSVKAVFSSPTPSAQAGALLNYLSFENRPAAGKADPVAVELRAQAAEYLTRRMPMDTAERFAWSEQMVILNKVRDYLDEGQAARVQDGVGNMARSRRNEIASMIENATRDWRWTELGILDEPAVVAAPAAAKSNVVTLKPSRPTAPERKFFDAADVRPFPEPELAVMLGLARRVRRTLGWGRDIAARPHDYDAAGEPVRDGERAVVLEQHGKPLMIASLGIDGLMIGFAHAVTDEQRTALAEAGVPLKGHASDRFKLYHDEAPLRDASWYQRWRDAFILGR